MAVFLEISGGINTFKDTVNTICSNMEVTENRISHLEAYGKISGYIYKQFTVGG